MFYVPPHRNWLLPRWSEEEDSTKPFSLFEKDAPRVRTDIIETKEAYILEADLPGFTKQDISIKTWDDRLFIIAKKEQETTQEDKNYLSRERYHSSVSREFRINKNVDTDKIKAKHQSGVLTVTLPKLSEGMSTQREITIE